MHRLDFCAGSAIRLTAAARSGSGPHRWDIDVFAKDDGASSPRMTFGSRIGGRDCQQQVSIPPQSVDCRVEVRSRHAVGDGWAADRCVVEEDTPSRLVLGCFANPSASPEGQGDVSLSFAFEPAGYA